MASGARKTRARRLYLLFPFGIRAPSRDGGKLQGVPQRDTLQGFRRLGRQDEQGSAATTLPAKASYASQSDHHDRTRTRLLGGGITEGSLSALPRGKSTRWGRPHHDRRFRGGLARFPGSLRQSPRLQG